MIFRKRSTHHTGFELNEIFHVRILRGSLDVPNLDDSV